jgi:small subunit ribosomal protein S20
MVNPAQGKQEKGPTKQPSAKKRQLQSEKRRIANKSVRSRFKTKVKVFQETVTTQPKAKREENVQELYSMADKAAKKHIFSKNKASRIKSRLAKKLNKAA